MPTTSHLCDHVLNSHHQSSIDITRRILILITYIVGLKGLTWNRCQFDKWHQLTEVKTQIIIGFISLRGVFISSSKSPIKFILVMRFLNGIITLAGYSTQC